MKLLFLVLRQAAKKWTMPIHRWREALNHFMILRVVEMIFPQEREVTGIEDPDRAVGSQGSVC